MVRMTMIGALGRLLAASGQLHLLDIVGLGLSVVAGILGVVWLMVTSTRSRRARAPE